MNSALSPASVESNDWSPINGYQAYGANGANNKNLRGLPDTPPISQHSSASTTDGPMSNGNRGPPNGNPSPPSSISRSSDGGGLYAPSIAPSIASSVDGRRAYMMEEALSEHYRVLRNYLAAYLNSERGDSRQNRARDKLLRLSSVQFQELSTDVYDELLRREDDRKRGGPAAPANQTPKFLQPKDNFHFKRNQARQKLSTLPSDRFRQLATDVFYELERRYPRFAGGGRLDSRAGSMDSTRAPRPNFAPPPRTASRGAPDMQRRGPSPFRNGSPFEGPPPGIQPGLDTSPNDYSRALPKTFQSNTIIPNKGMLVEDDDDDDAPRNLDGPTNHEAAELRTQVQKLEQKVDELQGELREKSSELDKTRSLEQDQNSSLENERSGWDNLRYSLEAKVKEAQDLNNSLQAELDRIRSESLNNERQMREELDGAREQLDSAVLSERELERGLRAQIEDARQEGRNIERDLRAQLDDLARNNTQTRERSNSASAPSEWRERYEALERELAEQRQTTEEVRREAAQSLVEMRDLSMQSAETVEKEERLLDTVAALEREVRDWKSRYAKVKSQNRSMRSSSMGLPGMNGDSAQYATDSAFISPNGLVKDFHLTNYQLAIDELLQLARKPNSEATIEGMKQVIVGVRQISSDIDAAPTSSSSVNGSQSSSSPDTARLKTKLSQAANNLITASKGHASAAGLAPVSLVDAAATHLTSAVIDLVRVVKIRPTPADEIERDEIEISKPAPLNMRGKTPTSPNESGLLISKPNGLSGHARNKSSMNSNMSSGQYSAYSRYSRYSNSMSPARENMVNGDGKGLGISPVMPMSMVRESGVEEFKNYLEDSTAVLVRSIQPLVNTIRTGGANDPSADATISAYIREISVTVNDIVRKTNEAVYELQDSALQKHAPPVAKALEICSTELIKLSEEKNGNDSLPPIAFRIARATKELVLRVDRIKSGELTAEMSLPAEF
ncbi:hypothetical protein EJ08DRAFT_382805 [Tothia fuscella]|uniref:GIT Spa2 homology (SHD) domain-containing protein n=1 Tax=Tothia fuscella TaxID=1048955 RepID=A0A9P4NLG8_9PEZI|nr:hypothetical protein EJ08DRAFT_382805 [Tothia fuscella]